MNFRHVTNKDRVAAPLSRLAAVVVTPHRLAQLQVTVPALLMNTQEQLAAAPIVDNASDRATGAWLAAQTHPRLVVIRSGVNTGGAGGFATGMKAAIDRPDGR